MAQIDSADLSRGLVIAYSGDSTIECNYCSEDGYMFYNANWEKEDNDNWLGKAATHLLDNHEEEIVRRRP